MRDHQTIRLERRDHVAVLTLDRPQTRNAIDQQMVDEIRGTLDALAGDDAVSALVLTGGEKVFASGADIGQLKERSRDDALSGINSTLFREVEAFPLPTLAAIEGWCLGGGLELALACDLRVAARTARMGSPEVGLGIVPAAGALYRLPRIVGLARAKELVFRASVVEAEEAYSMGLVNHLSAKGEALEVALGIAEEIAEKDRLAVRLAKVAFQSLYPPAPGWGLENLAQAICFESDEKHRRMQAFLDARAAKKKEG